MLDAISGAMEISISLEALIGSLAVLGSAAFAWHKLNQRVKENSDGLKKESADRASAIDAKFKDSQQELKSLGSEVTRIRDDVAKNTRSCEKLIASENKRRGREQAEKSGVQDMPVRRTHEATDTFTGG